MSPAETIKLDMRPLLKDELSVISFEFERELCGLDSDFQGGKAHISGSVQNHGGYFELSAITTVRAEAICARCFEVFPFELEFKTVQPVAEELQGDNTDEYILIDDGYIDLGEFFDSCLLLEKPIKLICREDCSGLCSKCGANLNRRSCGCVIKEIDPRLEKLRELLD